MSPKLPLPIFLTSRYFPPTMNSDRDVEATLAMAAYFKSGDSRYPFVALALTYKLNGYLIFCKLYVGVKTFYFTLPLYHQVFIEI